MAGIVEQQMAPPEAEPEAGAAMPAEVSQGDQEPTEDDLSPQAVQARMHLPPQLAEQLERVVLAGLKIMFDEKTHGMMLQALQEQGPMDQKLGKGVASLVAQLFQESQRSIPPQLLIPAGVVLCMHVVQFLEKAGMPVSKEDIGSGVQIMIETLLTAFRIDPAKVADQIEAATDAVGGDDQVPEPEMGAQPPVAQPAQPAMAGA